MVGKQATLDSVLENIKPTYDEYIVHIISNGGEVFEGYAIYNALKNTGKKITTIAEGNCASIASLIFSAGDVRIMNENSMLMIHNPQYPSVSGESKDLRNAAELLDKIKSQLIDSWKGRVKLPADQLSQMYDNETWLKPDEAVQLGFADATAEKIKAVAYVDLKFYNKMEDNKIMSAIENLTKRIENFFKSTPKNESLTLSDGTVITVETEGGWAGKYVSTADGATLPPGTYTLEDGRTFTVDENGNATGDPQEVQNSEDMQNKELTDKLTAAEARIKELESALAVQTTTAKEATDQAAQAKTQASAIENSYKAKVKEISDELDKIKNTTAGDQALPKLPTVPVNKDAVVDPMAAWYKKNIFDVRNTD